MEKAYGKGVRKRRTRKEQDMSTKLRDVRKFVRRKTYKEKRESPYEKRGPRDGLVSVVSMVSMVSVMSVRQNVKSTLHLFDEKVVST
nr:MAG: hypothetical protein AmFV_00106 [Apis mellifera filamentous virus]